MKEIIEKLKEKGFRITKSRSNLIELFYDNPTTHYTHDDIMRKLSKKEEKVNNMSVYNNLKILLNEDIIKESVFNGKKIYELSERNHAHFYCKICKKDIDIEEEKLYELNKLLEEKYEFKIEGTKIEFLGICKHCKGKNDN